MNARLVVCLALVALATPAFANDGKGASLSVDASVSVSKDMSKAMSMSAPAATPNPSTPAVEKKSKTLSIPTIDIQVKKAPLVTVTDAPCKNICHDVCSITLEKSCTKVPVTTKKCETVSKPITKRMCSKKCTLTTPAIEVPSKDKAVTMPNPSAPVDAPAAGDKTAPTMSSGKSGSVTVSLGKGRKLNGLLPLLAGKAVVTKVAKSVDCQDVCEDVASTTMELQCKDVTTDEEKCSFMPKKDCKQQCVCIPMKSVSLSLPTKPVSISLGSKGDSMPISLGMGKGN